MSLLLLLRGSGVAPPPPVSLIPSATVEIAFTGNPTATYSDIQKTQDGTLSFWRMNSATTFLDERLAHNGTILSTPTTTASPYAYDADLALQFDGSADGAYVASAADLTNKGDMTIAGWLRIDTYSTLRDVVAKRGAWLLQANSTGNLVFKLKDDNSAAQVVSNTSLALATWYHVAAVYDSTTISIYINGVLDASVAYTAGWEASTTPIRFAFTPSAAVPTWQSSTTATGISATATGTTPASTASGDLLLAYIHAGTNVAPSILTVPAGWTLAGTINTSGGGQYITCRLYYKVAGASEPASHAWGLSTGCTWIVSETRVTGVNTLTPLANPVYTTATSGASHVTGAHVPNVDNNMVLTFFSCEQPGTWTQSSGTERYDVNTGSNSASMSSQTQSTAASLSVTGTASAGDIGAAMWVALAGSTNSFVAASMKDWSFANVARSAAELTRDYAAIGSGTGAWTDVSTSVRSFNIGGTARQYELDQMEAGTTEVVLKDESRSFDPANTSSTYAPNVIPMRRLRMRTTYQGTVFDLAHVYIERWPPRNAIPGYQEIELTAVDGFDGLALSEVSGELAIGYSGAQINALLDKALWPKDARDIEQGQYVMAGQTLSGAKALSSIQEIADSERGIFFIDQSGVATFHDSAHRGSFARSTVSQATFVDTRGGGGIAYQDLLPSFDKDKIINEWTVTPDSGVFGSAAQKQVDAASAAQYWRRSDQRSTRLTSNADALAQAGNLLNETSQPALRFDSITVKPTLAADYAACLGLSISDRVTVIRGTGASWDGAVLTKTCFIEACRITALPGEPWVFTFSLSPVSSGNYRSTIVRDGPVSYWRMDTVA